jgi:hypothetical protein
MQMQSEGTARLHLFRETQNREESSRIQLTVCLWIVMWLPVMLPANPLTGAVMVTTFVIGAIVLLSHSCIRRVAGFTRELSSRARYGLLRRECAVLEEDD